MSPIPRTRLSAIVLVCGLAACSREPSPAIPENGSGPAAIVGAWELESRTVRRGDGTVVDDAVLGAEPPGRLFYSASGHVALQMMRTGRQQAITDPVAAADPKNARVVLGYDAYFGTFSVDPAAGTSPTASRHRCSLRTSAKTSCAACASPVIDSS